MTREADESGQRPTSPLFGSVTRVYRRSLRCHLGLRLLPCSCQSSKDAWKARACTLMVMELILTDMPSTTFSAKPYSLEHTWHQREQGNASCMRESHDPGGWKNASADQKVREWLPLARRDSYRGGAVGGARLFTRPHFYLYLIQELHMEKEEIHRK